MVWQWLRLWVCQDICQISMRTPLSICTWFLTLKKKQISQFLITLEWKLEWFFPTSLERLILHFKPIGLTISGTQGTSFFIEIVMIDHEKHFFHFDCWWTSSPYNNFRCWKKTKMHFFDYSVKNDQAKHRTSNAFWKIQFIVKKVFWIKMWAEHEDL